MCNLTCNDKNKCLFSQTSTIWSGEGWKYRNLPEETWLLGQHLEEKSPALVGLVPVHRTVLDSSEKVLMSRGLAEDWEDWPPLAPERAGFFWKGGECVRHLGHHGKFNQVIQLHTHTHTIVLISLINKTLYSLFTAYNHWIKQSELKPRWQ